MRRLFCGKQSIELFAHEVGHYLGLLHTFAKDFGTVAEAEAWTPMPAPRAVQSFSRFRFRAPSENRRKLLPAVGIELSRAFPQSRQRRDRAGEQRKVRGEQK